MNRKTIALTIIFSLSLLVPNVWGAESSVQVPFGYDELSATISIASPIENATYSSPVEVNVSVYIGGHENVQGTHYIPYQNISCIYSLDDSEWQNLTLATVSSPQVFPSLVNKYWHVTMRLNYTAILNNVSEGSHYLKIDVTPNSIPSREEGSEDKPVINFNIANRPLIDWTLIEIIIAVITVSVIAVSLIYVKKLKTKQG
ncbi:MAG: hypothetical protein ACQCN3_12890 [Candidatus Bathyarchaeia archaeon]